MILPGGGYAPSTRVQPGTPPAEPAGASSANPAPCSCCYRQHPHTGNGRATINPKEEGAATMTDQPDRPWTLSHQPRILTQHEARPGPPQPDGPPWTERRLTGYGIALCGCGYTTGLIPVGLLPDTIQFAREHPPFSSPALTAATGGGTP